MVIHTIIDEYDLLYAQQAEAAYAVSADCTANNTENCGGCNPLSAEYTRLPETNSSGGFIL